MCRKIQYVCWWIRQHPIRVVHFSKLELSNTKLLPSLMALEIILCCCPLWMGLLMKLKGIKSLKYSHVHHFQENPLRYFLSCVLFCSGVCLCMYRWGPFLPHIGYLSSYNSKGQKGVTEIYFLRVLHYWTNNSSNLSDPMANFGFKATKSTFWDIRATSEGHVEFLMCIQPCSRAAGGKDCSLLTAVTC